MEAAERIHVVFSLLSKKKGEMGLINSTLKYPVLFSPFDLQFKKNLFPSFMENSSITQLVKFDRPLLRIPQLAIHLNRSVNEKGLVLNPQQHLPPVFALVDKKIKSNKILEELVSEELGCKPADIIGLDLQLFDLQKGSLGGVNNEFIFSSR